MTYKLVNEKIAIFFAVGSSSVSKAAAATDLQVLAG
jgi:hypothetical protein